MHHKLFPTFANRFSPQLMGTIFILLWGLSISTAMAFAKALSPEVNNIVVLFMRYFFGFLFISPFIFRSGLSGFATSRLFLHLIRVLCVGVATGCTYYAYRNLPLAMATSIGMTGPLFITILSLIFLKDSISLSKWSLILFGYLGVLVMVRPHEMAISLGVWVELVANLFAAFAIICTKLLSRTESTRTLMLYTTTATTVIAGLFVLGVWKTPDPQDLILLMAVGASGVFSQFCYVKALKYARPSYLAPFEYTRLCFAVPVGYFFFQETPTFWTFLGSLMIVGSTYGVTRLEKPIKNLELVES